MTLELLINKRLRKNYNAVLKLKNENSIKKFLSELSEREKNELFAYTYGYAIQDRIRAGVPISEYFLLHYEDFIPHVSKQTFEKADRHLNYLFLFIVMILVIILFFK